MKSIEIVVDTITGRKVADSAHSKDDWKIERFNRSRLPHLNIQILSPFTMRVTTKRDNPSSPCTSGGKHSKNSKNWNIKSWTRRYLCKNMWCRFLCSFSGNSAGTLSPTIFKLVTLVRFRFVTGGLACQIATKTQLKTKKKLKNIPVTLDGMIKDLGYLHLNRPSPPSKNWRQQQIFTPWSYSLLHPDW